MKNSTIPLAIASIICFVIGAIFVTNWISEVLAKQLASLFAGL